jgi:hypothetical protein
MIIPIFFGIQLSNLRTFEFEYTFFPPCLILYEGNKSTVASSLLGNTTIIVDPAGKKTFGLSHNLDKKNPKE